MKKLKLLAAIAVLGIPLAACKEATPPPPVGEIVGTVSIEGTGIDGVSVNLSNGNSTTTAGGGSYRFANVQGGAYTVTISGYPSDATFDATSAAATISTAGQSVTLNFNGSYIRTASVMGSVTVENMGLPGVTVTLTGVSGATAVTDDGGQYAFTGLRMGAYSVEISGFDNDEVGFSSTAASVAVGVGESKIVSFDGTYLRTAGIMGRVSVEGEGLEGVNVSLSGGPDGVSETATTDASGQYSFAKLRAGDYAVGISGYDTDDYEFEVTSQNVTVALGETANVPFEGVLLRTSGISGRVSVEGMGLDSIAVTLSMADAEDMTAMTDAGGLYAFAGLAAGDYTVAITVESNAYVFETMSKDVTVGDDETAVVNFEGMHARTASVSGRLFIDELMKNDMHDEGENLLPHAGVPVVLVGPGVSDQMPSATDSTGAYSFMGLRAGTYQLVVPVTGPLGDFAYGGSATGYAIELGVGEAHTQHIPIDITHTTVHFSVMLKSGEMTGDALPDAIVTLHSDAAGNTAVGTDTTDAEGMASIRVARAGTSGNTVHAGISAEGYSGPEGMQAVTWDPQMTMTAASNDGDIVNLNVDVTVSGATRMTEYGGGRPLAGWAMSVMSGGEAVEGAPDMLGDGEEADSGMAAFKTTVASVPATFTFAVDTAQDNKLDGGEKFAATDVEYTHDGLSLAGTMDAGMMEVRYTTQTLKVYVHHERDQVEGYTGNVLGGDVRASGKVDVNIRYIASNGRSRAFTATEWKKSSSTFSDSKGVVTFKGVPADANVIAVADEKPDSNVMVLDPDELAAYTGMEANGIMGGAFGDMGGFHHTVELCPLMRTDPTAQDHGECGSFGFVSTYSVSGLVWKRGVVKKGDAFEEKDPVFVAGQTVSLAPVEGKNLAGEAESATTTAKPVKGPRETSKGTEVLDETHQFDFGHIAAGVYKLGVPDGWRARMGAKGAEAMLGNALSPLAGDLAIDVTPATATVYGLVNGSDGFGIDSVTVTANGVSTMTDNFGRYILEGIAPQTRTINKVKYPNMIFVEASRAGHDDTEVMRLDFAANSVTRHDFAIAGTAESATVSGTVTAFGSSNPIAGVEIRVDGKAPLNKNAKSAKTEPKNDIYVTGADGTYTIRVPATAVGATSRISAHKDGFIFSPTHLDLSTPKGSAVSGINFHGVANSTINGRVQAPGGGPLSGVAVTATGDNGSDADTTGTSGTFSLSVPAGTYTVEASKDGYAFTCPGDPASCRVTIGLGQSVSFGDFTSKAVSKVATLSALSLVAEDDTLALDPAFASDVTVYAANAGYSTDVVTVTATVTAGSNATATITPADGDDATDGHQVMLGAAGTDTEITVTVTSQDGTATTEYTVTATRSDGEDATLSALSLSDGTLDPAFSSAVTAYTADVGVDVDTITVTATATDPDADTVVITPADADTAEAGHQVALGAAGTDTEITVTVTAADGSTTEAYVVTVSRSDGHIAPSAPLSLTVTPADQGATLTWRAPRQIGSTTITGYDWEASATGQTTRSGTLDPASSPAVAGVFTQEIASPNLTNGAEYTFKVYAVNQKGETGSEVDVRGPAATATGKAQPSITLTLSGTGLTEGDTAQATRALTASVALSNTSIADVTVTVVEIVNADNGAQLTITDASIMVPSGQTAGTDSASITAIDDVVAETGVNGHVRATSTGATMSDSSEITITDNDTAPTAPTAVTATQVGSTDVHELTWTFTNDQWGTATAGRKFQYRVKTSAFEDTDADRALWTDAPDGALVRAVRLTLAAPASGAADIVYSIEVRGVSAAGDGAAGTASVTRSAS